MKKQVGKMLIQDMGLKVGEKFKVGRYVMVFAGNDGGKFDEIVPVKIWKRRQRDVGQTSTTLEARKARTNSATRNRRSASRSGN